MEDKIVVKSIKNWDNFIMSNFAGIFSAIITYVFICYSLDDLSKLMVGFLVLIFTFSGSFYLLIIDNFYYFSSINISENKIKIQTPFRLLNKTIFKNDIASWTEIVGSNKDKKDISKLLILNTKNSQFEISTNNYKNYEELKNAITYGIENDYNSDFKIKKNKYLERIYISTFLFLGLSLFSIFIFIKKDTILLKESDIIKLNEKVNDFTEKRSRYNDVYLLKLVKYPTVEFELPVYKLKGKLEKKLKIGESVSIGIRKIDYKRKIIKVIPTTIWHFPLSNSIEVYSLNTKHKSIIDLEDYYYENKLNPTWALMFYLTSSIVCLIIALGNFYNYKTV